MPSTPCDPLRKQGYQFFSTAFLSCTQALHVVQARPAGGEMCYKHQFYGISSHRCVQMTPTLRCNQRCLFCWRSFEHEPQEEENARRDNPCRYPQVPEKSPCRIQRGARQHGDRRSDGRRRSTRNMWRSRSPVNRLSTGPSGTHRPL